MRNLYRILRFLIVSLLSLTAGIPILLYVLLSLGGVHERISSAARSGLSELLGADVSIGRLEVIPFSRVELRRVAVVHEGDTLLKASELNAGFSMRQLLLHGRLVVTDVELMEPDLRVWRENPEAPLNVAPVLDRLKGDGTKKQKHFDLAVHTVVIRGGRAAYDVVSEPLTEGFCPAHIALSDLRADLTAPRVSDSRVWVSLKRLNFVERSGLTLKDMGADVEYVPDTLHVSNLHLRLPASTLAFGNTTIEIGKGARHIADIDLLRGSHVTPSDLAPLLPGLTAVPGPLNIDLRAGLFSDSLSLRELNVSAGERLNVNAAARASRNRAELPLLNLGVEGADIASVADAFKPMAPKTRALIERLGRISFKGSASWSKPKDIELQGLLGSDLGEIELDAAIANRRLTGVADARGLDLAILLPDKNLGEASFAAEFNLGQTDGTAGLAVSRLDWHGHTFSDITAGLDFNAKEYQGALTVNDSLLTADLRGSVDLTPGAMSADIAGEIRRILPYELGLWQKYEGYTATADIAAELTAPEFPRPDGTVSITNLTFKNREGAGPTVAPITLTARLNDPVQSLALTSDLVDFTAEGQIDLKGVVPAVKNLLHRALPVYFEPAEADSLRGVDFAFNAKIKDTAPLIEFLNLKTKPIYPVTLTGSLSPELAAVNLSAPYIQNGNKLIHNVVLAATLGENSTLNGRLTMPSKAGETTYNVSGTLAGGLGELAADWKVDCPDDYSGAVALGVTPLPGGADIRIRPGRMVFNNAEWTIEPTFVGVRGGAIVVNNLNINRPGQEAVISGVVSKDPADRLSVKLDNIDLDYVFATLQLGPAIQFGGVATGTVHGSGLLGSEPVLQTDDLYVSNFSYGHCVMGNANIRSRWNNETRGIEIHANIPGPVAVGSTVVDGAIFPISQELDFRFTANHTPVGFLKPLMSAFATNVDGTATGTCHLFGTFKKVDLEGDMTAENFSITIGFTGVTYYAGGDIRIRPGSIEIPPLTLRDSSGRTGRFSGRLSHNYFLDCSFTFNVTDADRLLVYDMPQAHDIPWWGKVRGTGSATIAGVPGYVKISAEMSTAEGTEFSFALSDSESASEYNFLTFRDITPRSKADSIAPAPGSAELHKLMLARLAREQAIEMASNYDFDFQIDVTPRAKLVLVMDPNAGDKITAYGSGHVGILYGSGNEDLRMYGDYRISRGEYNFSLQDIILKNFSIRDGSTVAFHGNPMEAVLDISAIYQLNANLSDLDESFLNDKEVQRTNVPVYAVLNVDGSIQDPQISFDIDFPTLSSDVKRKVASIVSTEEMMNRQIIYLLALNRFYTPDYMTATKGNELVSVASGTISSQLSNILGQLSDKISVAPSVRSDAGDFSDVEFDVALSSTLLNNRLLLNGNFGYRDKALNNNQFIGDFDVEYLLNRTGNWRLKAYNHFNDRNLYVKSALTTQGIGIVFKHDFDNLFERWRKKSGIPAGGTPPEKK